MSIDKFKVKVPGQQKAAAPAKPATTYRCGHPADVARMLNRNCDECRAKARKDKAARRNERRSEAKAAEADKQNGRLPHGSYFSITYNADLKMWKGCLWTPPTGALQGTDSGVFRLLKELDKQYREAAGGGDGNL